MEILSIISESSDFRLLIRFRRLICLHKNDLHDDDDADDAVDDDDDGGKQSFTGFVPAGLKRCNGEEEVDQIEERDLLPPY